MRFVEHPVRRALIFLALAAVLVPATLLLRDFSATRYEAIVGLDLTVPKVLTEIVMLGLIAVFGLVTWGFKRLNWTRIATAFAAGVGIVAAYGLSEAIKLFLQQERPCREVIVLDSCPAVGDWSFPSNHATIAFALATGIVIIARNNWSYLAFLGALAVGGLRVITGAHYPHDVLGGAILGITITCAVYLLLIPAQEALARRFNLQIGSEDRGGS